MAYVASTCNTYSFLGNLPSFLTLLHPALGPCCDRLWVTSLSVEEKENPEV